MPIKCNPEKNEFIIETANTAYLFHVAHNRFLQHDYYGAKCADIPCYKAPYRSFSAYCEEAFSGGGIDFSLDTDLSEFSFFGSGDFRCSSLRVRSQNGDSVTYFEYSGYEIIDGRKDIPGIPFASVQKDTQTLAIYLYDKLTECKLTLYYTVFSDCDVISRYFSLTNNSNEKVKIEKAMSLNLDLPGHNYDLISFYGMHNNERMLQRAPICYGNQRIMSRRGASSHQFNPFIALAEKGADEVQGNIYAFNFVYSGNFLDEIEVDQNGNTRVGVGLGDENFSYTLESGESFCSPEAVMTFTDSGLSDMSYKMHSFVRTSILKKPVFEHRPIVLNTWEACYFDIDEQKLIDFAKVGKDCGMDMLVMDDGWFGKRNHDRAGLGDWFTNTDKFPDGLKCFAERIKETGMKFGIWIEPEMINPDSDLYRAHPDWCLAAVGRTPSLSRHQLVLDMCNPAVLDYLKSSFLETFKDVPIDYIKWDFNRHLTEVGSNYLPADRQDEVAYRFYLGVYELYEWFRTTYPNAMIENCSGGGGRYDLAMMAYSDQIWTSDNTNARDRVKIQYSSSVAYPVSVMSCHVSNPGNGEDALKKLKYKFDVALGGMLGYELNVLTALPEVLAEIKNQTMLYRRVEDIIMFGRLYRLISPYENNEEISSYCYVADNGEILLSFLQNKGSQSGENKKLKISAADENKIYTDELTSDTYSGAELKNGIDITTSTDDEYSRLWLFVPKE